MPSSGAMSASSASVEKKAILGSKRGWVYKRSKDRLREED
jgi:hypothetical protein